MITYQLSMAALSYDAILKQISNSAKIETLMYQLNGQNAQFYVDTATQAKDYTIASGHDQAKGARVSAGFQIAGSIIDLGTTAASFGLSYYGASSPEDPATLKVSAQEEGNPSASLQSKNVNAPSSVKDEDLSSSHVNLEAQNVDQTNQKAAQPNQESQDQIAKRKAEEKSTREKKFDAYIQGVQQIGKSVNGITQASGSIVGSYYTDQNANDSGLAKLYEGLQMIYNSTMQANRETVQAEETAKQAALQLTQALVSASGVRG